MDTSPSVNINQLCSKSRVSDAEMNNLVQLQDSFSYDCGKYFNLAIIEETLLFSAGNLIQLLDTRTGALTFKRSVGGAGIGHITTNPHYSHVAVGERGDGPSIFVYTWPEFNLVSKLENGTERSYAYLDYSPDGEILCSQGAAPDFTLALWNWRRATLLMRCHPSTQVVHRAAFSRMQPDIIITCGYSHIGFWRTAKTFTGLKMTGEVGRFGATEASNVVNFECIEDGKFASGCEWGNILVWGGATIEYEICTRRDVTCHNAPVFAFHRHNNNLVSIGSDGWVRVWELNGGSRSQENSRVFRKQEALLYFSIGDNTRLFSKVDLLGAPIGEEVWFLQDGSGAIYRADVGAALQGHEAAPAVSRLLRCHATSVVAMATCPHDTKLATLAKDGRLLVYDYTTRQVLEREYGLPGTALNWLPVEMDDSGSRVAIGFKTGAVSISTLLWGSGVIREVQSWRPHSHEVTAIAASACALATASRDQNIFLFAVQMQPRLRLVPRGFIVTSSQLIVNMQWHHTKNNTLLACSCDGHLQEFLIADNVAPTEAESLKLAVIPERVLNLALVAPHLKLVNRSQEMEEESLNQTTVTVLSGRYHGENSVTLVLGGHPEFVTCKVNMETQSLEPSQIPMPGRKRPTVSCGVFTSSEECIVTGFDSGEIQLSLLNSDATRSRYWRLAMHEGDLGNHVTDVAFSFDQTHFFSCGQDGNIFVYRLTEEIAPVPTVLLPTTVPLQDEKRIGIPVQNITLTLEEVRKLKEEKRKANEIKQKRASIIERLEQLRVKYKEIVESAVGEEDLLPENPEELHPQLMEKFEAEVDKMRTEMLGEIVPRVKKSEAAWTAIHKHFLSDLHADSLRVCSFSDDCFVESYRLKKLDEKLLDQYAEMEKKLDEETSSKSSLLITESVSTFTLRTSVSTEWSGAQETTPKPQESVSTCPTLVLERMRQRHAERKLRMQQFEQLMLDKPPSTPDPETYEEQIREAEQNIGDYKLKCEPGYRTPYDQRASTLRTQQQKIEIKLKIYTLKEEFNREIYELKLRKNKLISRYSELKNVNESIKNNKALNEKMKLQDEELPEKDLLKLCDGRGSDFGIENFLGEEFYHKINTCVGLLAAMSKFDSTVRSQLEQRVSLDVRLCLLELRATSLRQELIVLTELEPQDLELTERLRVAREKKSKLQDSLLHVNSNIKKRKRSLIELTRIEKDIERRFHCHTEASSFYEHLTLLFKIRYRPPSLSIGSTVTESSHESETSSETTDTPHSTARKRRSVISDRVCPPGCELELFELTNALRLEKYELNLKLEEEKKDLELMKKDQEITIKKIKLVNNAIKSIREEIDIFEQERQERLNALQVAVPLSMHQLPADARLSECVVMPKATLERLQNRAGQLRLETLQVEEELADDKRKLKAMKLQCKTTENDILVLKNKIQETMLKRFGKVVNLEEMESAILNLGNEEKDELQSEREMKIKISQMQKDVSNLKVEINRGLLEKAENLRILASFMKRDNDLNEPKINRHERCKRGRGLLSLQHLHEVMTSQREQISSLRHELGMLRCKMTSSRDLFPSTRPASATNAVTSEESEATEEQTPGRRRRGSVVDLTSSTPEILIEHCSEEEDPELDD